MTNILLVGLGGFFGSASRYAISSWVHKLSNYHWFPYGTLAVNMIGCFVIGLLVGLSESKGILTHEAHLVLLVGFLGGFTTFSAFGNETILLLNNNQTAAALLNVGLQMIVCLSAAWLGHFVAKVF